MGGSVVQLPQHVLEEGQDGDREAQRHDRAAHPYPHEFTGNVERFRGRDHTALLYDDGSDGSVLRVRRLQLNLVHHVLTVYHLSESRVLAVQPRRRDGGDEKLASARVFA